MHYMEAHDNRDSGFVKADIRQGFNESGAHMAGCLSLCNPQAIYWVQSMSVGAKLH